MPKRVAITAYSFGTAITSSRIARRSRSATRPASRCPALHWDLAGWQQRILDKNKSDPKSVAQSNFQFQWVVDAATPEAAIEVARKFSLKDVAQHITCPFLVTHGGNDRVVPCENAQKLFDAVGSARKTIKVFTAQEGGAEHAHVDNRQVGIDFAADWLEANI